MAGVVAAAGVVNLGGVANAAPVADAAVVSCVTIDPVAVPAAAAPSDAIVSLPITCDEPACADGALTIVTDDSGVQHQACVASAVAVPPATTAKATFVLPVDTASTSSSAVLPATGSSSDQGLLLFATLLVGSGSLASFVSRRKL